MYLFTTPPATNRDTEAARETASRAPASANAGVIDAIRNGAQSSGAGFDYLLATAQRESALNPSAKAGTSSATGLFQFIEQTWLGTMKNAGPKLGLQTYADAITTRPDGTYTVADPDARQTILDLRRDPRTAATLAGALTQRNGEALTAALGREPTGGDLYAAHVLGARGAAALIATAQASPARAAALDMPEAAAANRHLFYDRTGRARGAAELYALLSTSHAATPPATAVATSLPEVPTAYAALDGSLRSLFQTDKRQGAVSEGVAKLWQVRSSVDNSRPAPTYFPRSDSTAEAAPAVQATAAVQATEAVQGTASAQFATSPTDGPVLVPPTGVALVGAPLPPRRPAEFNTMAVQSTAAAQVTTAVQGAAPAPRAGAPLNLSLYTVRSGL